MQITGITQFLQRITGRITGITLVTVCAYEWLWVSWLKARVIQPVTFRKLDLK